MATIAEQLQQTRTMLAPVAGELAALEARLLAQHAWNLTPEDMLRDGQRPLDEAAMQQLQALALRRCAHEPISQITGHRAFWKDEFRVTGDVLTPRVDSEVMLEALLRHRPDTAQPYRILDLGTGSGCLLLSALREYNTADGLGLDISPAALAVAQANAAQLGLSSRASFRQSEWCAGLDRLEKFAIVLTNPPYIARADIDALDEDVKGYEPHLALDGGADGLDCYRAIFPSVLRHLNDDALLLAEVGVGQAEAVAEIGEAAGLSHIETCRDLGGIARIVVFTTNAN